MVSERFLRSTHTITIWITKTISQHRNIHTSEPNIIFIFNYSLVWTKYDRIFNEPHTPPKPPQTYKTHHFIFIVRPIIRFNGTRSRQLRPGRYIVAFYFQRRLQQCKLCFGAEKFLKAPKEVYEELKLEIVSGSFAFRLIMADPELWRSLIPFVWVWVFDSARGFIWFSLSAKLAKKS